MRSLTFDKLFPMLTAISLSTAELTQLREWLAGIAHPGECIALIEQAARGRPCPHCHCSRSHRCGQASGLQRFRCLGCRRSYNALTGTPLARLRKKEAWLPYLQCVLDSRTVRQAAAVTGVHRTTSFRWRHRFVPGAAHNRPRQLSAIVEADETYRLESQKGSRRLDRPARQRGGVARRRGINREHDCLLVARDRNGGVVARTDVVYVCLMPCRDNSSRSVTMANPYLDDILATLSAMSLTPAQLARLREWIDGLGDSADDAALREPPARDQAGLPINRR